MTSRQRLAAASAALVVAVAAAVVLPVLTGQVRLVVTHGVSMQPLYHQGDLVVVRRTAQYGVGDIIAFDHEGTDATQTRVLHRVTAVSAAGFTTQGDNNPNPDPGTTPPGAVLGEAAVHLAGAGVWVQRAGSPWGVALLVGVPLLLSLGGGAAAGVGRRGPRARRARARTAAHQSPGQRRAQVGLRATSATPERRGSRAGPPPRATSSAPLTPTASPLALGVVLVLGATGLGLGVSALATPAQRTTTEPAADVVRTATLSYTATVRRSPVYDGTTVTSPAPVFRAVATGVDAELDYRGAAGEEGSIDLVAQLSSPGGWTTTVPVATGLRYGAGAATLQEPLDLDALLARSAAAAAVTGLDAQPLAVTLSATVTPDGADAGAEAAAGGPLVATMPVVLTDSQLSLFGDPAALVATASVPQTRTTTAPGAVSVLGVELPVGPARTAAAVLLVLSVLGGLVLAAVAAAGRARATRLAARSSTADRVAAGLADLLVPVLEVPGVDAAVEVVSPDALERLARAHELPVLHRRGHGAALFAVVVEGTTYTWSEHDGDVVTDDGVLLDDVLHERGAAPWDAPPRAGRPAWSPPAQRAALAARREPLPDEPSFAELLQPDPFARLVEPDPFARLGPVDRAAARRDAGPGPSHARR